MKWRALPVYAAIFLLLALLGGFAWFSRHPDSEMLARAEEWPAVGRLAAAFRRAYLPPPGPAPADGDEGEAAEAGPLARPVGGGPDGPDASASSAVGAPAPPAEPPTLWLAPGDQLHADPDRASPVVGEADAFVRVPRLRRRGDWHRVRLESTEGWLFRQPSPPGTPPLPATVEPTLPLPGKAPDPERLAVARELLRAAAPAGRIGPYPFYTDLGGRDVVWFLDRVAAGVEPAYRRRYGRQPVGEAAEEVVVFASEGGYRAFQARERRLADLPASGHAGYGLVALYVGDRRRDEIAATLVHEIAHLLNRRSLGPALPPWLDEGIAYDLAQSAIGPAGEIDASRLGGAVERGVSRIDYHGAQASVRRLAAAVADGTLPSLPRLFALDWEAFVRSDRLDLHYATAGFFWRYLLDGEDGALAERARAFLAAVAAGGPADAGALRVALDRTWADLEDGFAAWVEGQAGDLDDPTVWLHPWTP